MKLKIDYILSSAEAVLNKEVTVQGWVKSVRNQKTFSFIELYDGSAFKGIQIILSASIIEEKNLQSLITTGAALKIKGTVVESPGAGQSVEIQGIDVELIGACDPEKYPLQKKKHSLEFLRKIAHLRPRTSVIGAVTRIRHVIAFATHQFFNDKGFYYIHSPIITGADCEGAGEMFRITTLKSGEPVENEFFGKETFLTVSGQLNAEIFACAMGNVYTFGPTFRAENSNTTRHLAEFIMIEPEMAFADIFDNMNIAEAYLKFVFGQVLIKNRSELEFLEQFGSEGLINKLQMVVEKTFQRITYTEAIDILLNSNEKFEFPVNWGMDLQSEHEKFICEKHFNCPTIVTGYPAKIKAFYMRMNDDGKTVAAMDVLFPGIGEIIGGSQREERLDVLKDKMKTLGLSEEDYWWYLELREYGSIPHSGFGAGFERLVLFATGMENIRDVIGFPRYPKHAEF